MTRPDAIAHLAAKRDAAVRARDDRGAPWNHAFLHAFVPPMQECYRKQRNALQGDIDAYNLAIEALEKALTS